MIEVNLREARTCAMAAIRSGLSPVLMGSPGIGKTELFAAIAKTLGWGFLTFEASSLDPTDVRGLCVPDKGNTYFTRSPIMPDVKKHGKFGLLNIDELLSGLPAVRVALHALFHPSERRLGEHRIPEGWIPVATGNYATDGAGAYGFLTAESDRVIPIHVVVDQPVWKDDYAIPNGLHPISIGFSNFKPNLLSTFKERAKGAQGKAFASPRSHAAASKILYYADEHEMSQTELMACLSGCLGEGVASEIVAFRKTYKELPDLNAIFKGKDIVPTEPSILFALCSALVAHAATALKGPQQAVNRLLEYSLKLDAEFGGLMVRDMFVAYKPSVLASPTWPTAAARYF